MPAKRKIAIVHDFLYTYAGAERVLEQMLHVYPEADIFSLFDFLPEDNREFIHNKTVKTSIIQHIPTSRRNHRRLLPFMPLAIEQLDVSGYDLVISSSYVAAKGILTRPDQMHICYCHSPVRFAWDLQNQYLSEAGMVRGLKSMLARSILHYIRMWDVRSANGVDLFLANSRFIAWRIDKVYRRTAEVVYPPVDTGFFSFYPTKRDFYLTVCRMVPYKRVEIIVRGFAKMPDKQLYVIGEGPEYDRIAKVCPPNVRMLGAQHSESLRSYMQEARAFVYAAEEDFGIVAVEAQACGTPVIAFGRGGLIETVIPGETGVFFPEQTADSIVETVATFESINTWNAARIRAQAERFSTAAFHDNFKNAIENAYTHYRQQRLKAPSVRTDASPRTVASMPQAQIDEAHAAQSLTASSEPFR
jgi:glycosyltransferase involved in cell wall biosynthesis